MSRKTDFKNEAVFWPRKAVPKPTGPTMDVNLFWATLCDQIMASVWAPQLVHVVGIAQLVS